MQPNSQGHAHAILGARRELKRSQRKIVAAIVFDSLTQPLVGTRGATDARQVAMRAEELDVHLRIFSDASTHQITGQVFARNETGFLGRVRLRLLLNGEPLKTTWCDNFGQFRFDELPQGVFRLVLELPHLTVVGGITIGEQS